MTTLSQNIRFLIENSPYTEKEISNAINVTEATLNKIKNGININPTVKTLERIAKFFGVSVSQLIGEAPLQSLTQTKAVPVIDIQDIMVVDNTNLTFENYKVWRNVEILPNYPKNIFVVKSTEDLALPLITRNSYMVATKDNAIRNGTTVIINLDNNMMVKKIFVEGDVIIGKSFNSGVPDIIIPNKACIIAVVISVMTDL